MADVEVKDNGARVQYTAGGGQTNFTYPFLIFEATDLLVWLTPVGQVPNPVADLLTLNVDYTVTGVGNEDGGDVVLIVPATAGDIITIERDIPATQTVDLSTGGDFKATTINFVHDKNTLLIQQNQMLIKDRGLLYQSVDQLDEGDTVLPKLPANTGAGIPIWTKSAGGALIAGLLVENEDVTTLRSELASETQLAPGTDLIGYFDLKAGVGKLLTTFLNEVNDLIEQGDKYNYIINGDFFVWQRDSTFPFTGTQTGFTADRWQWFQNGGTTTVFKSSISIGSPGATKFALTVNRTVADSNLTFLQHPIENVKTLNSKTISLTMKAFLISPATKNITLEFQQAFGSGGSPSASVIFGTTVIALTQNITKEINLTFDVPNLDGKTIGTNGDDFLGFIIVTTDTGLFEVDFWDISIIESDRQHTFHPRLLEQEIALCERYYQKSYDIGITPGTSTLNGLTTLLVESVGSSPYDIRHTTQLNRMREIPSVVVYSQAGTINRVDVTSGEVVGGISAVGESSVAVGATDGVATDQRLLEYHWTAEAEL
jgi:hypothetical protein